MTEEKIAKMKANGYSHDDIVRFTRYESQASEGCIQNTNSNQMIIRTKVTEILDGCKLLKIVGGRKYLEEALVIAYENAELQEGNFEDLYYLVDTKIDNGDLLQVKNELEFAISCIRYQAGKRREISERYFEGKNIKYMGNSLIFQHLIKAIS